MAFVVCVVVHCRAGSWEWRIHDAFVEERIEAIHDKFVPKAQLCSQSIVF